VFGRATIRLGIGPHSSFSYLVTNNIADNANSQQSCNLLPNYYDNVLLPQTGNVIYAAIMDFTISNTLQFMKIVLFDSFTQTVEVKKPNLY